VHEPEPLEIDAVEGEEIAELAGIADDEEEIAATPKLPEEEESEW